MQINLVLLSLSWLFSLTEYQLTARRLALTAVMCK